MMSSKHSPFSAYRVAVAVVFTSIAVLFTACSKKEPAETAASTATVPAAAAGKIDLSLDEQKVSYGIGYNIGRDMAAQPGLAIDEAAMMAGISDALARATPQITDEEIRAAFMAVQQKVMAEMAKIGEKNLAEGNAFLETNKQRPEVTVTESGLQYEVLASGDGAKPTKENTVKVHYHGTLIDGSVFDSSVDRGAPVEFPVGQVIPGWTEALQLMSVGDKWKLYVPANLGYGMQAKEKIPVQSTLNFEVELLEIK